METGGKIKSLESDPTDFMGRSPSTTATAAAGSQPVRFAFVDGLRGLAALSIVMFHLWWYEPEPHPAFQPFQNNLQEVMLLRAAVQVLLVISGFVIAYTLRNCWVNPREVGLFLGRRLVRLTPPYWVTLATIIMVDAVCQQAWDLPSPFEGSISIPRLSAHMTFLQDVLGQEPMSAGVWTICIEMQFYVVAILAWGLAQVITRRPDDNKPRPSMWGILIIYAPLAFASLFLWRPLESTEHWVIHFLWMFFLGMIAWWTLDRTLPLWVFVSVVVVGVGQIAFDLACDLAFERGLKFQTYQNSVALTTAVMIYIAGRFNRMQSWLNWPWLQYISKISYSLYLIHFPVCHLLTSAGWRLFGDDPTTVQAMAIMAISYATSIFAAHWMYLWVEEPSNRISAMLKKLPARKPSIDTRLPQSV